MTAPMALAACGGGARQDANETPGNYPVQILTATFPLKQRLAERTQLVISVRNSGSKPIPNIAVTLLNPADGTQAQAFSSDLPGQSEPDLASRSRPDWIIDQPPGPCQYSCQKGGPGSYTTAYSNTWALGKPLDPGQSVKFAWGVTAVKAGHFTVRYQVAAGLNGRAHAVTSSGKPSGTFDVNVDAQPQSAYVNNAGQVVTAS